MAKYRNRFIFNQKGGSLEIDSTSEREKVKLSHRSGSNLNMTNVVTSELASNNKQTLVMNDSFETVGNDKSEFVVGNCNNRVGETTYELKGFIDESQIKAYDEWKEAYRIVAENNSQFKILRGGDSGPNGIATEQKGERMGNPTLNNKPFTPNNNFQGYTGTPLVKYNSDEVTLFSKLKSREFTPAEIRSVDSGMVSEAGTSSKAPGVLKYGAEKSAATEGGTWEENPEDIAKTMKDIQPVLSPIEQKMGNGGDEILITKRNKFEQVGATFNDYPSARLDPEGRSQPLEVLVAESGAFVNFDSVPHLEEVDNGSNFPCGNDDKVVGNRYVRNVGSGGISFKTTGNVEFGGVSLKAGFTKININAAQGIHIGSEEGVELQSLKTITLRTNRQVMVDGALGVKNNVVVGGGTYVDGELYAQHITAPLEVHQTEQTTVAGKFATDTDDTLLIAWAHIGSRKYPVYAIADHNLIVNYSHSHHYNGIAMRLMRGNDDVRKAASLEGINAHDAPVQALPPMHERKLAIDLLNII